MSLNDKNIKKYLSLRRQIILVVFSLIYVLSSTLIILFHLIVTKTAFEGIVIGKVANPDDFEKIISSIQHILNKDFWNVLVWVLIANALTDAVIAYGIAVWISVPIENLYYSLKTVYRTGAQFNTMNNEKFQEVHDINNLLNEMINKYNNNADLQNRFIQDISHELKTPLAALKSTIDVVELDKEPSLDDYKYFFNTAKLMTQKLIYLVNQLTVSNKALPELYDEEQVNLSLLMEELLQTEIPIAESKNVKINSTIQKNIKIKGSYKNLLLAISNILDNAVKYSDKKNSIITVQLRRNLNKAEIVIRDRGIGISSNDLKNVFSRFYRGNNSIIADGTGLGLSIAQNIIHAHNGKIKIKSQLGLGSEVIITL